MAQTVEQYPFSPFIPSSTLPVFPFQSRASASVKKNIRTFVLQQCCWQKIRYVFQRVYPPNLTPPNYRFFFCSLLFSFLVRFYSTRNALSDSFDIFVVTETRKAKTKKKTETKKPSIARGFCDFSYNFILQCTNQCWDPSHSNVVMCYLTWKC